jgi:hypothetical protein
MAKTIRRAILSRAFIITGLSALAIAFPLASSPTAATHTARGPICESITVVGSTTYRSCSGSIHTALDISNQSCSEWNHRGMILGSVRYNLFGGCAANCANPPPNPGCNGGAGNYFVVYGASGWDFRQLHFNTSGNSYTRTCDRCALGLVGSTGSSYGAHSHSDNRQYGTRMSAWYTSVGTTCGSSGYCENVVGQPTL